MAEEIRTYKVLVDGFLIKEIILTFDQYKDQTARDIVRSAVAKELSVPKHYIRLAWADTCRYVTNMQSGKQERID